MDHGPFKLWHPLQGLRHFNNKIYLQLFSDSYRIFLGILTTSFLLSKSNPFHSRKLASCQWNHREDQNFTFYKTQICFFQLWVIEFLSFWHDFHVLSSSRSVKSKFVTLATKKKIATFCQLCFEGILWHQYHMSKQGKPWHPTIVTGFLGYTFLKELTFGFGATFENRKLTRHLNPRG